MKADDARVLLTGATGGIGRATAFALARAGAAVLLAGRSPARLAALARELGGEAHPAVPASGASGPRFDWVAVDLASPKAMTVLRDAAEGFGVNVLVNNAGQASFGRFDTLSSEHLEQVLQTNLLAPMRLTQAVLPLLRRQREAHVIQVGSALGRLALPGFGAYSASKFGLLGFTEALRREEAGGPVRVHYLAPRTTRTGFNDDAVQRYNRATHTASDPPERVAAALLSLLDGRRAERFIGFPERLVVRLNALLPGRLDALFAGHRRQLPHSTANDANPLAGSTLEESPT